MGNFTEKLSARILLRQKSKGEGYCIICGKPRKLSKDHIPPKSVGNFGKVEQLTITEYYTKSGVKPLKGNAGNIFQTICASCNGDLLGSLDGAVAEAYKSTLDGLKYYVQGKYQISYVPIRCDVRRFCRSLIGHIIAAVPESRCMTEREVGPYFKNLYDFVRDNSDAISESHDIYLWFYPHKVVETVNFMCKSVFLDSQTYILMSFIKFFPFGFAVAQKGSARYFQGISPISINDGFLRMSFSPFGMVDKAFPYAVKSNEVILLDDAHTSSAKIIREK